jgi:hypothetical protein
MKTIVVNLFGGPGVSKSTTAAGIFHELKKKGVNCELVREFAKERVWLGDTATLNHQAYVTIKQYFRQCQVDGKVDVIITDSPFLIGLVYPGRGTTPGLEPYLMELWEEFYNVNMLLVRDNVYHPYNPEGRQQTEEEAERKDKEILDLLDRNYIPYEEVRASKKAHKKISKYIRYLLKNRCGE